MIKNNLVNKMLLVGGLILSTGTFQSCKKALDINVDPNNPDKVPIATLLTNAEVALGYTIGGNGNRITGSIVQYYAGHRGQPLEYAQYKIVPSSSDNFWSAMYADVLMDLRKIEDQANTSGDKVYQGISQILQAYSFSVLTDQFGDIPFSEALNENGNITPKYDKQEAVYDGCIALIEKGVANVKSATGTAPSADDVIFGGSAAKWEAFGNSLKLRLLNHLSKRRPGAAATYLATNPTLITSNDGVAQVVFGTTQNNANPIHSFDELSGRKDNAVANTIVDKMKALTDPRIPVYFLGIKNGDNAGQIIGNAPGDDTDDSGESRFSRTGSAYASINSPVVLLSAAEVAFIIAEIRFGQGDNTAAEEAYKNAITLDFSYLGVTGIEDYLANADVAYNGTLQRIMEQKWITMYQAPFEAWVDWRRTGFPVLTAAEPNRTGGVIPRSISYPQIEINVNGASLSAGPGIPVPYESLKKNVWWDM